jgi:uncharacterized alkaline shock family protein YloU
MNTGETTALGRITISPTAIATIACRAVSQSYGIVGMASKNLIDGIAHALAKDPRHGVEVRVVEGHVLIDLYVVVEYGTRISSVAASVANAVKYQVEKAIGLPVAAVNIHVQDLRVSDRD